MSPPVSRIAARIWPIAAGDDPDAFGDRRSGCDCDRVGFAGSERLGERRAGVALDADEARDAIDQPRRPESA